MSFQFSETLIKLNNPLITLEEKAFFLKKYVSPHTVIHFDGKSNIIKIDINDKNATTLQEKLMNRVGDYLKTGNISLGTISLGVYSKKEALDMLKNIIDRINIQFDMYVRANHSITTRIGNKLFDGKKEFELLYGFQNNHNLKEIDHFPNIKAIKNYIDNKKDIIQKNPIAFNETFSQTITQYISGLHPNWQAHPYQVEFIKLCRENLLWTNAYATGLGKTSTALMVIQDQHNLQFKKRTVFLVPKSTLSNWHKESFIGQFNKEKQLIKAPVFAQNLEEETIFVNLLDASKYKNTKNIIINYNGKDKKASEYQIPTGYEDDPIFQLVLYLLQRNEKLNNHYDYLSLSTDSQLKLIRDNVDINGKPKNYKKIFMSHQDFYRIRMKADSTNNYINYLKLVDADFAQAEFSEGGAYAKKITNLVTILHVESHGKNKQQIYFEDMGIDSLVIDEAHIFKNSTDLFKNNYDRVKYFSTPPASAIGIDLLAKAHYVKDQNITKDGVLALTATPLTNSPLEIYSILSLVIGQYFINKLLSISSINDFLTLFCMIDNQEDYSVDGDLKNFNVFKGINNLKLLRKVLFKCTYFLHSTDERIQDILKLPTAEEHIEQIKMGDYQQNKILAYKIAYNFAKEAKRIFESDGKNAYEEFIKQPEVANAINPVMDKFNEHPFTMGSPFNFIRKMERLVLDEDMNELATILFIDKKYKQQVSAAVKKFNAKKYRQVDSVRLNPHTSPSAIYDQKEKLVEDGDDVVKKVLYNFYIEAKIIDLESETDKKYDDIFNYLLRNHKNNLSLKKWNQELDFNIDFDNDLMIIIDTLKYKEQLEFFRLLCNEFQGIAPNDVSRYLKFNISNKMTTFFHDFMLEYTNPRGLTRSGQSSNMVKQLVFCDYLGMHFKIQHLIHQLSGLDIEKIAIITGQYNNENEQIQGVQDGYNADDYENLYQVVIANEKAQEGINLQIGTQAIHHLTIGWTPDANIQRNGRGVRQGNKTEIVRIYNYDLQNTFDTYKRNLVNKKNDWINTIIDANGKDYIFIIEMLSQEQQNRMIELIGNQSDEETKSKLLEYEQKVQEENRLKEIERVKNLQRIYLDFIDPSKRDINVNQTADNSPIIFKSFVEYYNDELAKCFENKIDNAQKISTCFNELLEEFRVNKAKIQNITNKKHTIKPTLTDTDVEQLIEKVQTCNKKGLSIIQNNMLNNTIALSFYSKKQVDNVMSALSDLHMIQVINVQHDKNKTADTIEPEIDWEKINVFEDIGKINRFLNYHNTQLQLISVDLLDNKNKRHFKTLGLVQSYIDELVLNTFQYLNFDFSHITRQVRNQIQMTKMYELEKFLQNHEMFQIDDITGKNRFKIMNLINDSFVSNINRLLNVDKESIYTAKRLIFIHFFLLTILIESEKGRQHVPTYINYHFKPMLNQRVFLHIPPKESDSNLPSIKSDNKTYLTDDEQEYIEQIKKYACGTHPYYTSPFWNIKNNPILDEIQVLEKLEHDVVNMAIDGYKNLSKSSQYTYYPDSMIDNMDEIYYLDDLIVNPQSLIFSIGLRRLDVIDKNVTKQDANNFFYVLRYLKENPDVNLVHNEQTIVPIFEELKQILLEKTELFKIVSNLQKFFRLHNISVLKIEDDYRQTKMYPIEFNIENSGSAYHFQLNIPNSTKKNYQNQFSGLPLLNKSVKNIAGFDRQSKYDAISQQFHKLFKSEELSYSKHFEVYPNDIKGYYDLLIESLLLLEYGYLHNINHYDKLDFFKENKLDKETSNLFEKTQSVFKNTTNPFYFNYLNLETYNTKYNINKPLSSSIIKQQFDGVFNNIYEVNKNKIQMILDYTDPISLKQPEEKIYINNKNNDIITTYPSMKQVSTILLDNNISMPPSTMGDFFIINIDNSYQMFMKYKYREIAMYANESIYFHKNTNKSYSYRSEKEAFSAFKDAQKNINQTKHNNQWIIGKKTLALLLYNMINDPTNGKDYLKIKVYTLDGNEIEIVANNEHEQE